MSLMTADFDPQESGPPLFLDLLRSRYGWIMFDQGDSGEPLVTFEVRCRINPTIFHSETFSPDEAGSPDLAAQMEAAAEKLLDAEERHQRGEEPTHSRI